MTTRASFATTTKVTVEKTKADIDLLLRKNGASQTGIISDSDRGYAAVLFVMNKHSYRIEVPLPTPSTKQPKGWTMWPASKKAAWSVKSVAQKHRTRWRVVYLALRAKLELIALEGSTVEREFLADLVLPGGQRVEDALNEQLARAFDTGVPPKLLLSSNP